MRGLAALTAVLAVLTAGRAWAAAELVMFESARCPWCVKWHRELGPIYPKTEEGRLLPLRRVDHPGTPPKDLKVTGVKYTPTFVVVDCGREIGRVTGYASEDQFWGELGMIIESMKKDGRPKARC